MTDFGPEFGPELDAISLGASIESTALHGSDWNYLATCLHFAGWHMIMMIIMIMAQTYVQVINEARTNGGAGWELCLQWCRYNYPDGASREGYRFIWRDNNGKLQPYRGQARIPSLQMVQQLLSRAAQNGWDKNQGPR